MSPRVSTAGIDPTHVRSARRLAALLRREGRAGQPLAMLELCARRAPGLAEAGQLTHARAALRAALAPSR